MKQTKNIEAGAAEIAGTRARLSGTTHGASVLPTGVRTRSPFAGRHDECRAGRDMATGQELNYNTGASALDMALEIFGAGTVVVDATYTGWSQSSAIYSAGDSIAPGATPSDRGVILSTGRATTTRSRTAIRTEAPAHRPTPADPTTTPLLNAAAGTNTYDAAILEVDFIPTGNVMTLQFQFASEEYPEFTGSTFNDIFAIWMNGTS
jgi:hypothetical protein